LYSLHWKAGVKKSQAELCYYYCSRLKEIEPLDYQSLGDCRANIHFESTTLQICQLVHFAMVVWAAVCGATITKIGSLLRRRNRVAACIGKEATDTGARA
jgi:hypothetical protein